MRRTLLLLGCVASWLAMPGGVAAASCVEVQRIERDAVADFEAHVVRLRKRGAILAVDLVRRGKVRAGDRVEVADMYPNTSVGKAFALGERYRVLPQVERRPYMVNDCLVQPLPGRVELPSSLPAMDEGEAIPWVAGGAALLVALAGGGLLWLRRRK